MVLNRVIHINSTAPLAIDPFFANVRTLVLSKHELAQLSLNHHMRCSGKQTPTANSEVPGGVAHLFSSQAYLNSKR